jgi:hypothetical protein
LLIQIIRCMSELSKQSVVFGKRPTKGYESDSSVYDSPHPSRNALTATSEQSFHLGSFLFA